MKRPKINKGKHLLNNTPFTTNRNILSCLFFVKIKGKVAVKSGSTATEEVVWGGGTRLLDFLGLHNMLGARFDQHF